MSGLKREETVRDWRSLSESALPKTLSREDDSFDVRRGLYIPGVM